MPTARQTPARAVAPLMENIWCWLAGENKSATVAAEVREPSTPVARARPDNAAAPTPSIQVSEESATGPAVRAVGSTRGSPRGASRMSSSHAGAQHASTRSGPALLGAAVRKLSVTCYAAIKAPRACSGYLAAIARHGLRGAALLFRAEIDHLGVILALPPTPSRARATRCRRPTRSTACAGRGEAVCRHAGQLSRWWQ
jgi:hypothetical protein